MKELNKKMGRKKHILMDIDGVLCPFGQAEGEGEVYRIKAGWNSGYIRRDVALWLKNLERNHTVVWFTTWLSEANKINKMLGIAEFEVIDVNSHNFHGELWQKWGSLLKFCDDNKEDLVIVVDDDAPDDSKIRLMDKIKPSNLFIFKVKDPMRGLSYEEMQAIKEHVS